MFDMTCFILISQNKEKRRQYIHAFALEHAISQFDITVTEKDEQSKNLQSLGIEDIKHMQKKLFLKPMQSKEKLVILDDAQLLTIEAQNSLLKILEEPPENTYIILSSQTRETILPTIISRCQVVELEKEPPILTSEEEKEFVLLLTQLPSMTIGDRLKKAETLGKSKDEALVWLEKMILTCRQQLLKAPNPTRANPYVGSIQQFQRLYVQLKSTNVNPRFAIEHTLLNL